MKPHLFIILELIIIVACQRVSKVAKLASMDVNKKGTLAIGFWTTLIGD